MQMSFAYYCYEAAHRMLMPARAAMDITQRLFESPLNPLVHTPCGGAMAAARELFERTTRRYNKPRFDINQADIDGLRVPVVERVVWERL
jgi:poly(3-hydroxybutyrate) depolymerase